jgi:hypothetical protein
MAEHEGHHIVPGTLVRSQCTVSLWSCSLSDRVASNDQRVLWHLKPSSLCTVIASVTSNHPLYGIIHEVFVITGEHVGWTESKYFDLVE